MVQIAFRGNPVHMVREIAEEPDNDKALNMHKNAQDTGEALDTCVHTSTAEHARADDIDEPCDDGRAG